MKYVVRIDSDSHVVEYDRKIEVAEPLQIDGHPVSVDLVEVRKDEFSILINGRSFLIRLQKTTRGLSARCGDKEVEVAVIDPRSRRAAGGGLLSTEGRRQVTAPMPGKVVRVLVAVGDKVDAGQGLVVVEAMKMQNEIRAPKGGKVERLLAKADQTVAAGETLAVIA